MAVELELDAEGRLRSAPLVLAERVARLGERETPLVRRRAAACGAATLLRRVPRGRYPIEETRVVSRTHSGSSASSSTLAGEAPRSSSTRGSSTLDRLFSESGARTPEGRRLLMRRPSGFDLHSVRDYEQGESLRRVHWPTTARRGHLMVKELEDSPRDETAVLLDADAGVVVGEPHDSSFELAVRAAGSVVKSHAARGRSAALRRQQPASDLPARPLVRRRLAPGAEILAAVEPDGRTPLSPISWRTKPGPPRGRSSSPSSPRRSRPGSSSASPTGHGASRRPRSSTWTPSSFATGGGETPTAIDAQILRLERAGVPVLVLRHGDDLAAKLSAGELRAVV